MIARDTQHAVAHHLLGRLFFQTNRKTQAVESLNKALAIRSDYAEALLDLANMFSELGQIDQAEACLQTLVGLRPRDATAWNNLGVVRKEQSHYPSAIEAYQRALELDPQNPDTLCNLAHAFTLIDALDQAADVYQQAISIESDQVAAHRGLISVLRRLNRHDEARDVFTAWLRIEPDNPVPQYLLSAYGESAIPQRAPDAYVRQVFDQFATTFESDLARLEYQGPEMIERGLIREYGDSGTAKKVLDGGCGTGLCGPVLRRLSERLIGVDLSRKMLQVAQNRNVYDELVEAELSAYLADHPAQFDLIVCADTFGYFGELSELFSVAHQALCDGGRLLATVELGEVAEPPGYQLHPSGRYSHHRDYIVNCCVKAGFAIHDQSEEIMRYEAEKGVRAMVLTAVAS
jgi:predicted TPR repeat methyltransferase